MDIEKIRNEALTEDAKMEMIADYLKEGGDGKATGINVVVLGSPSGVLSDEDFDKVSHDNCVIVASTQYFYKQYDAATVLRYGSLPRLISDNTKIIFDYVDIDKGNKTYEAKYDEVDLA